MAKEESSILEQVEEIKDSTPLIAELPAKKVEPSITALSILMMFIRFSHLEKYRHLFTDAERDLAKAIFEEAKKLFKGTKNETLVNLSSKMSYGIQRSLMENVIGSPGTDDCIFLRKMMLRLKPNEILASETPPKQVVYLGGGFDVLQFFNALQHPEVNFYEIDRGPTQACKIEKIKEYARQNDITIEEGEKYTKIGNMYFIHADLAEESLETVLDQHIVNSDQKIFDPQEKSLFMLEGVLMYLQETEVKQLITSIRDLNAENELIASFLTKNELGKISRKAQTETQELFKSTLPIEAMPSFLNELGGEVCEQFTHCKHLIKVGNIEAARYYQKHPEHPMEYYVRVKFTNQELTQNIQDIPEMSLRIPRLSLIPKPITSLATLDNEIKAVIDQFHSLTSSLKKPFNLFTGLKNLNEVKDFYDKFNGANTSEEIKTIIISFLENNEGDTNSDSFRTLLLASLIDQQDVKFVSEYYKIILKRFIDKFTIEANVQPLPRNN